MLNRVIDKSLYNSYSADIPNFLKKIYAARTVVEADLSLSLANLLKPNFRQLDTAVLLLEAALIKQKRIVIVGDFDADGATASVVAIKALRMLGAKFVDFIVPNRFQHGYGLSPKIVSEANTSKNPDLIITVDNGICSVAGVSLARSLGIEVIITDHHLPSDVLPNANAIINPNLDDSSLELKNLSGVGVCFYLFSALKTHLGKVGYFVKQKIKAPDLRELLDLVALGTVADVVKLDKNNRILVNEGVKLIRKKLCSQGILAILETTKHGAKFIQAADLGFLIAPKINAAGRLDDISQGIRCLLSYDVNNARRYARRLDEFNNQRKQKQSRMQTEAEAIVNNDIAISERPFAIVLFAESWHEGVVGIVAGKLKENYKCPCAVFAISGKLLKGSIRSIADIHIKDLLDLIARENPNLIESFGGHAMAAGISIKPDNFSIFKKVFTQAVAYSLDGKMPATDLLTDGMLNAEEITLENAELLYAANPWGQGFEEPIFYNEFALVEQTVLALEHLKLVLKLDEQLYNAIAFFHSPIKVKKVLIAYKLSVNRWHGRNSLQLIVEQIKI